MKQPDGSYLSTSQFARSIVGNMKDERAAVRSVIQWYMNNTIHTTSLNTEVGPQTNIRLYGSVFPQNPANPPSWAIQLVQKIYDGKVYSLTDSGLNVTSVTAVLRSLGIPSEANVNIVSLGNFGVIVVDGAKWYWDGDAIFSARFTGATTCTIFGTYQKMTRQVTSSSRLGDGSFCL